MNASTSPRILILSWLGLVALSITTVLAADLEFRLLAGGIVLLAGFSKALIIIDRFMELRHASLFWRLLMLGWPLVMALSIGLGMLSRLPPQ